ncbi:hypothetical protein L6452_42279 [Arctium lappa]|uniref:Uncharacterized protein n=1 Tax=Arctium lappa TaxID=4217 RepID=A0ACB8XJK2_ARCLA|nr:hypothetical protein L6452_42279 [Arctium lappa]
MLVTGLYRTQPGNDHINHHRYDISPPPICHSHLHPPPPPPLTFKHHNRINFNLCKFIRFSKSSLTSVIRRSVKDRIPIFCGQDLCDFFRSDSE